VAQASVLSPGEEQRFQIRAACDDKHEMAKATSALALLAAVLVVAGCGAGSKASGTKASGKAVSGSITVAGTTTMSNVKTGTKITCRAGGPTLTVPEWPGQAAAVSGPVSKTIGLTRSQAGLVISCGK
jgi:ABC-type phosphate transport system substrate-binding protein